MHSSLVLSRELPTEQVHTKEPGLLMHSPLMQGLDSHSFTSAETKDRSLQPRAGEAGSEAAACPLTLADVRLRVEAVTFGTLAGEAPRCVSAQPVVAQQPVHQALVHV